MTDDDLTGFDDHPVVRALRATAQEHELLDEEAALAMFRSVQQPRRRRTIKRAAIASTGVVVGLALSGGVAAAYGNSLPRPMQDAVHAALAPLPIPAPPRSPRHTFSRVAVPPAVLPPSTTSRPTPSPTGSGQPATLQTTPPTQAAAAPGASAAPSPSAAPTPAPPPSITVTVSRSVVPVHGQVVVSGRLGRGDEPLSGRLVYLAERPAGASSWRRITTGRTGSDGTISLTTPELARNVRVRLVTAQGVTSSQLPVAVVPTLSVTSARSGNQRIETVSADGGRAGDALVLLRRDGDTWTRVDATTLGGEGTAQFTVPGPGATLVRYRVRLPATAQHAASYVAFSVPAR